MGKKMSNKLKLLKNTSGFTLIEVMLAILILAFGMMAMALLQVTAIRGGSFSNQMTQASILGQDKIEELKNTDYSSIVNGSDTKVGGNGVTYTRAWTVTESDPPGTPSGTPVPSSKKMKTINLTVSWTGPQGNAHSVQFSTIVNQ